MSFELIVYGGGEKVVDYLNAVASIINSNNYKLAVLGAGILSLFVIFFQYYSTYRLELHKIILTIILGFILLNVSVRVIVTDKRNVGANYVVDNVPVLLAFPLCFANSVSDILIKMFSTAYSTTSGMIYGYPDKNPMFLPKVLEAHFNTSLSDGVYKANLIKYIRRCVAPRLSTDKEQTLYTTPDILNELIHYESNIWTITDWCEDDGTGRCGSISSKTCKEAYDWLSAHRTGMINDAILRTVQTNELPVKANEVGNLYDLYKNQVAEAYKRFLGYSSIDSATTILNAAISNLLTDGFEAYASQTGNDSYLLSLVIAQARQADSMNLASWAVIASEKLYFLKEYIFLILISLFPIVGLVCIISGFHRILMTYSLMLLWIGFWDVANVITEALNYHYLESLKDVVTATGVIGNEIQNITNYATSALNILHRQIVLAGFISGTITPTLAAAMVFGLEKLTGSVASSMSFGQQATTQAGISLARGDVSLGNRNILNDSMSNTSERNITRDTWTFDNINAYQRNAPIEILSKLEKGINFSEKESIDFEKQTSAMLQSSHQAVENAIEQFTSKKAVTDTFNTIYQHSLSRFKGVSQNNLQNLSQSEQDSYRLAQNFVKSHGFDSKDTYKVAALIESMKNTIFGYKGEVGLGGEFLGKILKLGVSGHIGREWADKEREFKQSDHQKRVSDSLVSSLADAFSHDKNFQKQFMEQLNKTDGINAQSGKSTAHILAGNKEFAKARQKLFQALEAYNRILNTSKHLKNLSSISIPKQHNTLTYAKENAGMIFSRVLEAAEAVKLGKASSYHQATYNLARKVLGVKNPDEMLKVVDSLNRDYYFGDKNRAVMRAEELLRKAVLGGETDGSLNDNEIALANFLGHTEILNEYDNMQKTYSQLTSQFSLDGKFSKITDRADSINEDNIEKKVDSGWITRAADHESKEEQIKSFTFNSDGADSLASYSGYNKRFTQENDNFDSQKNYEVKNWTARIKDKSDSIDSKEIKQVKVETGSPVEKTEKWIKDIINHREKH